MAFYLEGKTSVDTNDLSPKEATQMSHDVKYIGMDVHKEAIVIAVLNESGKQVIESVIETQATYTHSGTLCAVVQHRVSG